MIAAPVIYSPADQELVDAFEALGDDLQDGNYWSDDLLAHLRSSTKTHYIAQQNTRCCYCNRHLGTVNHRHWDLEHVASRAKHPRFMFVPKNLSASCPDCNLRKGEQETLVNPNRKTYPTKSNGFRIVHPHFDTFSDHIYQQGMVYLAKTEKGKKTIYMCDLLRFAQEFIDWENSAADTTFEPEVEAILKGADNAFEAVDALAVKLNDYTTDEQA